MVRYKHSWTLQGEAFNRFTISLPILLSSGCVNVCVLNLLGLFQLQSSKQCVNKWITLLLLYFTTLDLFLEERKAH